MSGKGKMKEGRTKEAKNSASEFFAPSSFFPAQEDDQTATGNNNGGHQIFSLGSSSTITNGIIADGSSGGRPTPSTVSDEYGRGVVGEGDGQYGEIPLNSPTKKQRILSSDTAMTGGGESRGTVSTDEENDHVKSIMTRARSALNDCGAYSSLKRYLVQRVDMVLTEGYKDGSAGGATTEAGGVRDIIIGKWIEELIRFLTIKTVAGDVHVPSEMLPSRPVDEAWKGLIVMPAAYVKVCQAMGNEHVIDRESDIDKDEDEMDTRRQKKRFNGTLRAYHQCFESEPPHLFWPDPSTAKKKEMTFFSSTMATSATSALQQMVDKVYGSKELLYSSGIKRMFDDCNAKSDANIS